MSGIAGIFERSGATADYAKIRDLANFLSSAGPDGTGVWCRGPVALGHAMLRATPEASGERQPAGIDAQLWITADARLDARTDLIRKLENAGCNVQHEAPDCDLILHAYAIAGERCVEHLRGDFAFAIWDARWGTLFCARDHFGVKPFYYADFEDVFVFSNLLECLRLHPAVGNELNEDAIADFLLFGLNSNVATTTFRDVRRLPAAHFMKVSTAGLRVQRYWTPPVDGGIRYRRADEYVEHFQLLLRESVADRVRGVPSGVVLNGGLDSFAVAATARELSTPSAKAADLRAYTVASKSLPDDPDGAQAREVTNFLRIPIHLLPFDKLEPFERLEDPELGPPEPTDDPFFAGVFDQFQKVAADCRVLLDSEGADHLMHFERWPYARHLARNGRWRQLLRETPRYLLVPSSPWPGMQRRLGGFLTRDASEPALPKWLTASFARRANVKDRWKQFGRAGDLPIHPIVPKAHGSLLLPHWTQLFELQNPGITRSPVEVRYPYLDLRIVNYILALPSFPWSFQKTLLREAMIGHLPESVRCGPETPLKTDPLTAMLQEQNTAWIDKVPWSQEMDCYVHRACLPKLHDEMEPSQAAVAIRPFCLNFWLQSRRTVRQKVAAEVQHAS